MEYNEAIKIADNLLNELKPHCERIEIAGSLRRRRLHVKDIEIVLIPKPYETGLFKTGLATIFDELEAFNNHQSYILIGKSLKDITAKIHIVERGNYGLFLGLRTAGENYRKTVLLRNIERKGYLLRNGFMTYNGKPIATPTEEDFFNRIGVEYRDPTQRK